VAFTLALSVPLWLLVLGPLLLGVPHLIADIRYLLVRPPAGVSPASTEAIILPLALMTVWRILVVLGGPSAPEVEFLTGALAEGGAAWLAPGSRTRRVVVLGSLGLLTDLALTAPQKATLYLAYAHNGIGFGLWVLWSRGEGPPWRIGVVTGLFVGAIVALVSGVCDPVAMATGAVTRTAVGLDMGAVTAALTPGVAAPLSTRLILVFVLTQTLHYVVWLRLVPGQLSPRSTPMSVQRSLQALRQDLGATGLRIAVGLTLLVPLFGLVDPLGVRAVYLSLALFHAWLELAVLASQLVSSVVPRPRGGQAGHLGRRPHPRCGEYTTRGQCRTRPHIDPWLADCRAKLYSLQYDTPPSSRTTP
jgi:hypothetical protein